MATSVECHVKCREEKKRRELEALDFKTEKGR